MYRVWSAEAGLEKVFFPSRDTARVLAWSSDVPTGGTVPQVLAVLRSDTLSSHLDVRTYSNF
tara:strand:+ start:2152 stop:2337 length:186 start_codon:yes stop_codon:yes gene_type:complete